MSEHNIAVVTGANKGLGFAMVKGLCQKYNGSVYLTSRDENRGKEACKKLEKLGYAPQYHQLDVTDEKSIMDFCSFLRSKNMKIDLLINNAGILFLKDAKESKIYQAEQTVFVNFLATINFTEVILPLLNNHGTILNISSSSGHLSRIPSEILRQEIRDSVDIENLKSLMQKYLDSVKLNKEIIEGWGNSPYVVSKVVLNAYTFMLHRRLKDRGILVNCVHPGYVMSDMTKGVGTISPEAAADVVLKLALDRKSKGLYVWHNGATVPWDGPDPRGYIDGKQV